MPDGSDPHGSVIKPWRVLDSRQLVRDRWMKLRADTCELPTGGTVTPYYVVEESDWTQVLARDDQGRLLVVTQYRHGAGVVCAEFPGGVIDAGEPPLVSAQRELLEETGYLARHWRKLGSFLANPARQTNRVHVFVATGLTRQAGQNLDATEEIACAFCAEHQVRDMIASGSFSQGLHIASFYMSLDAAS